MRTRAKLLQRYAADYEGMFAPVLAMLKAAETVGNKTPLQDAQTLIKREIAWAKTTFGGNNAWVVWWLRWYRLSLERYYTSDKTAEGNGPTPGAEELYKRDLAAYQAKAGIPIVNDDVSSVASLGRFHQRLEHYMGTPCQDLKDYRPGYQTPVQVVNTDLRNIEKEWQESRAGLLEPEEGDEILIKFPDGYAWWLLDRGYCSEEAKAMGHCGNAGAADGDRILSLRQPKGKEWYPYLTFILDGAGQLGEMKGRNNDKPVAKYHPYIIALLKNDIVKDIKGGGYKPENNFSVADLTPEQREDLYKLKPILMTAKDYYAVHGLDATLIKKLLNYFSAEDSNIKWDEALKAFIVEEWKNRAALIEDKGDNTAKWVASVLEGNEYSDYDRHPEAAKEMLGDLGSEITAKIGHVLLHEHKAELNDWLESENRDEDEPFNPSDEDDIISFAEHVGADDLLEALANAHTDGTQRGSENEMYEALESGLKDSGYQPKDPADTHDSPWYEVLDVSTALEMADKGYTLEDIHDDRDYGIGGEIKVQQPHYGFSDYDKAGAIESFNEGDFDLDKRYEATLEKPKAKKEAPAKPRAKKATVSHLLQRRVG